MPNIYEQPQDAAGHLDSKLVSFLLGCLLAGVYWQLFLHEHYGEPERACYFIFYQFKRISIALTLQMCVASYCKK